MNRAAFLVLALVAACTQQGPRAAAADLQDCSGLELNGELAPAECQFEAAGSVVQVRFAPLAAGTQTGAVELAVLDHERQVAQTLLETEVAEYRLPSFQDVDGDGRADILIPRMTGNVNTEYGVWIYSGERQRYERAGEVSGVAIERTADGYIAVPARSSAASWNVAFYRLDGGGLHPLVTLQLDGEELSGGGIRSTCAVSEAPGLRDIDLDERAAREKFCAEPAAEVFGQ